MLILLFTVTDYEEYFVPIDNRDNPNLLLENWPHIKEPYQREVSNTENNRHIKPHNNWNANNDDYLLQNNNLTTMNKLNFIHVLHSNEQLDKTQHEEESKIFIPNNGSKQLRLKRKLSKYAIQSDNIVNGNDVENKNANAPNGNQKHQNGTKKISTKNDDKQQQENTLKDSVVR